MDKLSECVFRFKMMTYQKYIILFRIKLVLIPKKEFDSDLIYNQEFSKKKIYISWR